MAAEDGSGRPSSDHRLQLLQEMRGQNFDMIRFASYRTACKLRFVQKKANRKLEPAIRDAPVRRRLRVIFFLDLGIPHSSDSGTLFLG
jgi:hypothetical protein